MNSAEVHYSRLVEVLFQYDRRLLAEERRLGFPLLRRMAATPALAYCGGVGELPRHEGEHLSDLILRKHYISLAKHLEQSPGEIEPLTQEDEARLLVFRREIGKSYLESGENSNQIKPFLFSGIGEASRTMSELSKRKIEILNQFCGDQLDGYGPNWLFYTKSIGQWQVGTLANRRKVMSLLHVFRHQDDATSIELIAALRPYAVYEYFSKYGISSNDWCVHLDKYLDESLELYRDILSKFWQEIALNLP